MDEYIGSSGRIGDGDSAWLFRILFSQPNWDVKRIVDNDWSAADNLIGFAAFLLALAFTPAIFGL